MKPKRIPAVRCSDWLGVIAIIKHPFLSDRLKSQLLLPLLKQSQNVSLKVSALNERLRNFPVKLNIGINTVRQSADVQKKQQVRDSGLEDSSRFRARSRNRRVCECDLPDHLAITKELYALCKHVE